MRQSKPQQLYRVRQKKTTHWHFSSHVRNFQQISNRIVLSESQVNYRSYFEQIIKIDQSVSKILTVKVKRRIIELNGLKWLNFCSHDHGFSAISDPEAVLKTQFLRISVQFVPVYCEK